MGYAGLNPVLCNGVPAAVSSSTFSCSALIVQGSISIGVQATDFAGISPLASVSVNLQGPKLTVTFAVASDAIRVGFHYGFGNGEVYYCADHC